MKILIFSFFLFLTVTVLQAQEASDIKIYSSTGLLLDSTLSVQTTALRIWVGENLQPRVEITLVSNGTGRGTIRGGSTVNLEAFRTLAKKGNQLIIEFKRDLTDEEKVSGYKPLLKTLTYQ